MSFRQRFMFDSPQWRAILFEEGITWKTTWRGHGSDEYGNCSVYFTSTLLGGITFFWDPHFQRQVLVPSDNSSSTVVNWESWYEAKFG